MARFCDSWKDRKFSPLAIVGMVIGGIVLAALFGFLFGWVVMLLWNWLMPEIFKLPRIGYWQAWGLVILSHILIKPGFGDGGRERGPRDKGREWKRRMDSRLRTERVPEEEESAGDAPTD